MDFMEMPLMRRLGISLIICRKPVYFYNRKEEKKRKIT